MNRKKLFKIGSIVFGLIIVVAISGYVYISSVSTGNKEANVPEGYEVIEANGYHFSTRISGNKQHTPVILLHGFPESAQMWTRLMNDLNSKGYYTIAPDQRGYSAGARPLEKEKYQLPALATDVMGIADALGLEKFHLIGHDWGGVVGWQVAADHSERLISYTSLSVPHLDAFVKAYMEDSAQFAASNYIRQILTPKLPEFFLAKNNYENLRLHAWGSHSEDERNAYFNLFSQKNALSCALNWYRANYELFIGGSDMGKVSVPSLFIWGNQDPALKRYGAEATEDFVNAYYRFVELDAAHWLVQEKYEEVYDEISSHLERFTSEKQQAAKKDQ